MTALDASFRDLARRLQTPSRSLANSEAESGPRVHEALIMFETLRTVLSESIGFEGYAALARSALVLARVEAPELRIVRVGTSGELEGLEEIVSGNGVAYAAAELTAQLLALLASLIGEAHMLRLVRRGWPETELGGLNPIRP